MEIVDVPRCNNCGKFISKKHNKGDTLYCLKCIDGKKSEGIMEYIVIFGAGFLVFMMGLGLITPPRARVSKTKKEERKIKSLKCPNCGYEEFWSNHYFALCKKCGKEYSWSNLRSSLNKENYRDIQSKINTYGEQNCAEFLYEWRAREEVDKLFNFSQILNI